MSVALSLYLTAWFALFPLLEVAHLTFADHAHRYCNEHGQIEDVPREYALTHDVLPLTSDGGNVQLSWLNHTPDVKSLLHIACSILNHKEARDPLLPPGPPELVTHPDQVHPLTFIALEGISPYGLLFTAPKTSPPLLAA